MYNYSPLIRRVMYTTIAIEAFHRQLRRVTKTKGSFTSDTALMKLLYLVQRDVTVKWQKPMLRLEPHPGSTGYFIRRPIAPGPVSAAVSVLFAQAPPVFYGGSAKNYSR